MLESICLNYIPKINNEYQIHEKITCEFLFHVNIQMKISGKILNVHKDIIDFKNEALYIIASIRGMCNVDDSFCDDLDVFWTYYLFMDRLQKFRSQAIPCDDIRFKCLLVIHDTMTISLNNAIYTKKCNKFVNYKNNLNMISFKEYKTMMDLYDEYDYYLQCASESIASIQYVVFQIMDSLGEEIMLYIPYYMSNLFLNNIMENANLLLNNFTKFFDNTNRFEKFIYKVSVGKYAQGKNDDDTLINKAANIIMLQKHFIFFTNTIILRIFDRHLFYMKSFEDIKIYSQKMSQILNSYIELLKPFSDSYIIDVKNIADSFFDSYHNISSIRELEQFQLLITHSINKYYKQLENINKQIEPIKNLNSTEISNLISHSAYIDNTEELNVHNTLHTYLKESIYSGEVFVKYLNKLLNNTDIYLIHPFKNVFNVMLPKKLII
ncbi:uncharacterized protein LOC126907345 [Daktulosphaira vitifoliae]|uniref:uncharacterized protein LOC126907345 n=1 Tax=Daktulosphaira vitifoliae TaxID=58002 RepID=UPI0021AA0B25|nr:uncharacterized protein LOC126907345 [Daktulosphaira vitifoliae]